MHGSRGSRLASLSGLERSATAAEEEGRKGQIEGENRRRRRGPYITARWKNILKKEAAGQIMNCGEFTSASVDGKE